MKGRAGVVFAALALAGVLTLAVYPTSAWLDQRRNRTKLAAEVAMLSAENRALEDRVAQLGSDEEIERMARQYNLVKPGEEAYFILPRPADPEPPPPPPEPKPPSKSLWDRIVSVF